MYALGAAMSSARNRRHGPPSDELRLAVTFRRPDGSPGPANTAAPLSIEAVRRFIPDPLEMDRAIHEMNRLGFRLTRRGQLTASMRCTKDTFQKMF